MTIRLSHRRSEREGSAPPGYEIIYFCIRDVLLLLTVRIRRDPAEHRRFWYCTLANMHAVLDDASILPYWLGCG